MKFKRSLFLNSQLQREIISSLPKRGAAGDRLRSEGAQRQGQSQFDASLQTSVHTTGGESFSLPTAGGRAGAGAENRAEAEAV